MPVPITDIVDTCLNAANKIYGLSVNKLAAFINNEPRIVGKYGEKE